MQIPAHIPWEVHRIAVSRRYTDSLHTILTVWGLSDVRDANDILDAIEAAEESAAAEG